MKDLNKNMREELFEKMLGHRVNSTSLKIIDGKSNLHELEYFFFNNFHRFGVETKPTKILPETRRCPYNVGGIPCQCTNDRACEMCLSKNAEFAPKNAEELFFVVHRLAEFKNTFKDFSWEELAAGEREYKSIFNCNTADIPELDFQFIHKTDKEYIFTFEDKTYIFWIN